MKLGPFEILETLDPRDWPEDAYPYADILDHFDSEHLGSVLELLKSDDKWVTRRGLFLFGYYITALAAETRPGTPLVGAGVDFATTNGMRAMMATERPDPGNMLTVSVVTDKPSLAQNIAKTIQNFNCGCEGEQRQPK